MCHFNVIKARHVCNVQLNYRNIYISYASSINKLSKPTMVPLYMQHCEIITDYNFVKLRTKYERKEKKKKEIIKFKD